MKQTISLFALILFMTINNSYAQLKESYEKGSIIQTNDEKINGFIKTEDLDVLSSEVCFKIEENDTKCIIYSATKLKSFSTETGKFFESLTIKVNRNKKEINVFANLILKGKASLYKCIYNTKEIYIIVNNNMNYVLQNDELISGETEIRRYNYLGILNVATDGMTTTTKNIEFSEKNFINILTQFNTSKGFESNNVTYNEKKISFIIVNVGGGFKKNESEFFIQGMYRTYFPKISRSTSLNIGINYFNYNYLVENTFNLEKSTNKYNETLTSIPIQIQQNFLNKSFRPYIFMGMDVSYLKIVDQNNNSQIENGLQSNFGVGILYGAGIEYDIYKGLMVKCEYRKEVFTHLILFGIGYNFSK